MAAAAMFRRRGSPSSPLLCRLAQELDVVVASLVAGEWNVVPVLSRLSGASPRGCSSCFVGCGVVRWWICVPPRTMRRQSLRVALSVQRVLGLPHTVVGPLETPLGISAFQSPEAVGSMSRASQCSPVLDSGVFLVGRGGPGFSGSAAFG